MLSQPVTASGGVVSSQWASGWGAAPPPSSPADLALFAAVILLMVLAVALAAVFVRDEPPGEGNEAGRRACRARRPAGGLLAPRAAPLATIGHRSATTE